MNSNRGSQLAAGNIMTLIGLFCVLVQIQSWSAAGRYANEYGTAVDLYFGDGGHTVYMGMILLYAVLLIAALVIARCPRALCWVIFMCGVITCALAAFFLCGNYILANQGAVPVSELFGGTLRTVLLWVRVLALIVYSVLAFFVVRLKGKNRKDVENMLGPEGLGVAR